MMSGSDIVFTTIHVITDWPISDHMIGTSYRGPVQQSVVHALPGSGLRQGMQVDIYKLPPAAALLPSGRLCTWTGREVVKVYLWSKF
ncbi:unnamed protein product [Staurois parvus]|uniref:Uncharacterized protein n=1 Tax=Staurois parvus TaxID=386267 RepID=A0ABN9E636_9NEOB|nr:unnamed protein product [Staurois parvus]